MSRNRSPRFIQRKPYKAPLEDPYSPKSAAYAERHETRESGVVGLPGLTRVDMGG